MDEVVIGGSLIGSNPVLLLGICAVVADGQIWAGETPTQIEATFIGWNFDQRLVIDGIIATNLAVGETAEGAAVVVAKGGLETVDLSLIDILEGGCASQKVDIPHDEIVSIGMKVSNIEAQPIAVNQEIIKAEPDAGL